MDILVPSFGPSLNEIFFFIRLFLCRYWAQCSVSAKQINNNHLTDSQLHLTYQIYLRKLLLLANPDSMSACQLWDNYLLGRREKPIVLRGFQKITHLKEVSFHYARAISVILKKTCA